MQRKKTRFDIQHFCEGIFIGIENENGHLGDNGTSLTGANMNQIIVPMLSYEDGVKAIEWLCRSFGFKKKEEWIDADGRLSHGEIELSGQRILLATPSRSYICPAKLRKKSPDAAAMYETPFIVDGLLVYVENIATHFATAKENGALILSAIEDGPPGKRYRTEDPEGHRWMFMENG